MTWIPSAQRPTPYDVPAVRSSGAVALLVPGEEAALDEYRAANRSQPEAEDRGDDPERAWRDDPERPWTDEELARERAGLERILARVEANRDELRAMAGFDDDDAVCSRHGFVHQSGHCWDAPSRRH